jgi:hypothetical protein
LGMCPNWHQSGAITAATEQQVGRATSLFFTQRLWVMDWASTHPSRSEPEIGVKLDRR